MGIAGLGVVLELSYLGGQVWHSIAQQVAQISQAGRRQRRVEIDHPVQQLACTRAPGLGAVVLRQLLDRLVDAGTGLAPYDTQQPAIVQALEQMARDIQVAAPALHAPMVEMRLHVLGVGVTTLTDKSQNLLGAHLHRGVPGVPGPRLPTRMQQGQSLARQETVIDEEALFDRQARVAALQLAGAIVLYAVRENQILGSCGRAHRVGLDKAQARNGSSQAGGLEKAPRDCVAAKLLEAGGFGRAHAWCPVRALGLFAPTSRGAV